MTQQYELQETHFRYNDIGRLKVKRYTEIHHAFINQRKGGVAILVSHKADLRAKKMTGVGEGT